MTAAFPLPMPCWSMLVRKRQNFGPLAFQQEEKVSERSAFTFMLVLTPLRPPPPVAVVSWHPQMA